MSNKRVEKDIVYYCVINAWESLTVSEFCTITAAMMIDNGRYGKETCEKLTQWHFKKCKLLQKMIIYGRMWTNCGQSNALSIFYKFAFLDANFTNLREGIVETSPQTRLVLKINKIHIATRLGGTSSYAWMCFCLPLATFKRAFAHTKSFPLSSSRAEDRHWR